MKRIGLGNRGLGPGPVMWSWVDIKIWLRVLMSRAKAMYVLRYESRRDLS